MADMMNAAARLQAGRRQMQQPTAAPAPAAAPAAPMEMAPAEQPQQLVSQDEGSVTGVARNAREQSRRQTSNIASDKPATKEEQAEYQRATDLLSRVLYEDPNTSKSIIDALQPENKVGSVAQTAILVLSQLDNKADLDEAIIPQMTMDIVDRLIDMGEQTKGMQFSDEEAQGALGAAWEGVMQVYGTGNADDFAEATQDMSDDELKGHTQQYRQMLGSDF